MQNAVKEFGRFGGFFFSFFFFKSNECYNNYLKPPTCLLILKGLIKLNWSLNFNDYMRDHFFE